MRKFFSSGFVVAAIAIAIGANAGCSDRDAPCEGAQCAEADAIDGRDVAVDSTDDAADVGDEDGKDWECEDGEQECVGADSYRVCRDNEWGEPLSCGASRRCMDGACMVIDDCTPGPVGCVDTDTVRICNDDRFTYSELDCEEGTECLGGQCLAEPCSRFSKTYIGCEFWAVDLANFEAANARPVAVSVSNFFDLDADVTLTNWATRSVVEETVRAGEIRTFTLNDIDLDASERTDRSYLIESNAPVTVHQFNPRNNSLEVFSNDASLLLPSGSIGTDYRVIGWPTEVNEGVTLRAYMTIVATAADTTVRVVPSVDTRRGDGIPAMTAGEEYLITMMQGEVVSVGTVSQDGMDLTGTIIESDEPVVVFSGVDCANVPRGVRYCDHLEQQLAPVDTWDSEFVATGFAQRGTEPTIWRVLALRDGTDLSTDPPVEGLHGVSLDAGELVEVSTALDFVIDATGPIAVAQFMVGSEYPGFEAGCDRVGNPDGCAIPAEPACFEGNTAIGDPSFLLAVPMTQFRREYFVLVPEDYRDDYFSVVAREGTTVDLDGTPLDLQSGTRIGDSDWFALRLQVLDGQHRVTSEDPFGLTVYGYDCDVSYAYPGGLDLDAVSADE